MAYLVLLDESGLLMAPLVKRTWALRGHRPSFVTKGSTARRSPWRPLCLGVRLARVPVGKEIVMVIAPEEKKPSVEPKQSSADPDRRAAEWVLSGFGVVIIQVGDRDFEVWELAKLPQTFRLIFCNVSGNQRLSDEVLAHFRDCRNLRVLQMIGSSVRDDWLVHFKNCTTLVELDLSATAIGDAGLAPFKDCKQLAHLNLERTQIGDASGALLSQFTNLVELRVKQTRLTAAKVNELAKALPKCRIESDHGTFGPGSTAAMVPLSAPKFTNSLGMEFVLVPKGKSWLGGVSGAPGNKEVILHSKADDVVPFEDSEELAAGSGATLIEVGNDHRLADQEPLERMSGECEGSN